MGELVVEIEPTDAGFDVARLEHSIRTSPATSTTAGCPAG